MASHIKRVLVITLAAWTVSTPQLALAQKNSPTGSIDWSADGRPRMQFSPKMALGLYVKASDSYLITFFGSELTAAQQQQWLSRSAMIYRGKFEGKAYTADAALDRAVNEALAQSVSLWGKLEDGLLSSGKRGNSVEATDFKGAALCVGRNCNYYSGGVYADDFKAQVKRLSLPLAASGTAQVELAIEKSDVQRVSIQADVPFFMVND